MKILIMLFMFGFAIALPGCSKEETPTKTVIQPAPHKSPLNNASEKAGQTVKQVTAQDREQVVQVAQQVEQKVDEVVIQTKSLVSGQLIYTKACLACHKFGLSGAPKVGDKKTWEPLITEGAAELTKNAINGVGRMPPKGGNSNLSDADVKAAVDYMIEQSR